MNFSFKEKLILPFIAVTCLLGTLIYSNTFQSPFVFDDLPFIVYNTEIKDLTGVTSVLKGRSPSRFVTYVTFALNYHFHQLDVFGYHLVNLLIHLMNSFFIYWFLRLTFSTPYLRDQPQAQHAAVISILTALLFLVHPIQTQAVTYITQRFASLATMFYLVTLCCYIKARLLRRRGAWYVIASTFFGLLGMFTKEIVFTLPFMIIVYDVCFFRPRKWSFQLHWFFILLACLIIPVTRSFRILDMFSVEAASGSYLGEPLNNVTYLLTQFKVIVTYIRLLFVPINQNLFYEYPASTGPFQLSTFLSFLFLASLFFLGLKVYKRHRLVAFGIFWFFLTLSVESSIFVIRHVIFEHRVYLPSVGFFLAVVVGLYTYLRNIRLLIIIFSVVIISLSFFTYQRNQVWQTGISLWSDVVQKSPNQLKAWLNLGVAYSDDKQYIEAIKIYTKMIDETPNAAAFSNRGNVYSALGEYDLAIRDYKKAIAIKPQSAQFHSNRADAYTAKRKWDLAIKDYSKAIEIRSNYYKAYARRANVYRILKKFDFAMRDYDKAISLNPYEPDFYIGRGAVHFLEKRYTQARDDFSQTLKFDPDSISAYMNRGNTYSELGEFDQALSDFDTAIHLAPLNGQIYFNRGVTYRKIKDKQKAAQDFEKAKHLGYKS